MWPLPTLGRTEIPITDSIRHAYAHGMALEVRLLGQPSIIRDGVRVPLGGRKPWGLLAYLLLEQRPTRREVASRLISEANDPLAALRSLLHQLRRAIEPEGTVGEHNGALSLDFPTR